MYAIRSYYATENKTLHHLSRIDSLTQINNRHAFNTAFEELFTRSHKEQSALSILFFDIDFFKKVNDTYGHDTGDEVLIALSKLVSENIRTNDILARWGGEEFIRITSYNVCYTKLLRFIQRINHYLQQLIFFI